MNSTSTRPSPGPARRLLIRLPAFLLVLAFLATGPVLMGNPFYVSPNGDDTNSGAEAAPFKTIERARIAARAASAGQSSDVVVYLRAGRYEPADTLRFDGNDSGRNGHRVIYRSYLGEEVLISGGRRVTGWSHFRDGIYQASSPVAAFRQIYINGRRGIRARTPDHGYERLSSWGDDKTIRIPANRVSAWSNLTQVEMVISKHWHQSRLRIASFNTSGDTAIIVPQEPERTIEWKVQWPNREPDQPYFFENSLDFLNQPGEWYLDRGQQKLYYMPRPDESIQNADIIAPRLERILEINGASNLSFIGLTFEHAGWTRPDLEGFVPIQANLYAAPAGTWLPSGVHLEFTNNVHLERNVFRNMGGGAIDLHRGTHQTRIVGNAIADVAASGISVYTQISNRNPPDNEKSRGDIVRNNYVTRVGRDYPGGVAIVGTYTDGMIVEHNELFDNPYTGISVGWGWTNQDTALRNNLVRYNRIHQVMNLLDDGAGIYTLSKQPGGLYEENFIYDLTRNPWAGGYEITALYLDEQTEGVTMRNNVVRNLSGVNLFKQNRVQDGLNNVYNNGDSITNADSIIAKAGLQEAYRDIPSLVSDTPRAAPGPFRGTPHPLPGRIEAEDFDHGGAGKAYHDTTALNQGGQYRPDENVDIETCADSGGGHNIGYIRSGEWLEYTVSVNNTGTYSLLLRLASIHSGRHFRLTVDGENVTGSIEVPNTSGWQNWKTVTVENVSLAAGERKLRVAFDTGDFNLNWIEAVADAGAVASKQGPFSGVPAPIPGRILAADFDTGGPGIAYHDLSDLNKGGTFRPDEWVDIEPSLDAEAPYNVGWVEKGEWIHYTVEVREAGYYDLHFRVASLSNEGRFHLQFDGRNVTGELQSPATGGWQNWTTVTLPHISLTTGVQTMRLSLDGGEFNISAIEFDLAKPIASFKEWQSLHFSGPELENTNLSSPTADPHGTGIPNLLCYAFNRAPGIGHRKNLPVAGKLSVDGETYLTLTYTRLAAASDLAYVVEASSNLSDWTTADDQVVEISIERAGNIETVTVRDIQPLNDTAPRFLRLRVTIS